MKNSFSFFAAHVGFCLGIAIVLTACKSMNGPTPSPTLFYPNPPVATSLTTKFPPVATLPSALIAFTSTPIIPCPSSLSSWTQMNTLKGFYPHAGIAGKDGCHLWLAGEQTSPFRLGAVIQSDNGGLTFQRQAGWPQALHVWSIVRDTTGTFWVAADTRDGNGLFLKSTDSGQNWVDISIPIAATALTAVAATDEGVWVGGIDKSGAFILTSADGGNHWQEALRIPFTDSKRAKISVITAIGTTVIAVGSQGSLGLIAVGQHEGTSFQLANNYGNATAFGTINLIDATHAYIGGYYTATGRPEDAMAVLLQTSDGGATFKPVTVPNKTSDVVDILFLSPRQGYMILTVGNSVVPYIVHSNGENNITWEPMSLMPKPDFGGVERLFAADDGTVFAVGLGGIYRIAP